MNEDKLQLYYSALLSLSLEDPKWRASFAAYKRSGPLFREKYITHFEKQASINYSIAVTLISRVSLLRLRQ